MSENKTIINWFPGHMAKALREIQEKIQLVDLIIELVDARAINSTSNPLLKDIIKNKMSLKVVSKIDLADEEITLQWQKYFKENQIDAVFVNLNNKTSVNTINNKIKEYAKKLQEKDVKRGLKPRNLRVMVTGIPNVGKSTFINSLAKKRSAGVGNKPGFTKAQQWIHTKDYDLLDTPGVLWPNLSNNDAGIKLALIGCVKSEILPNMELAKYAIEFLDANYPNLLYNKYMLNYEKDFSKFLEKYAIKMGHLFKKQELNYERSCNQILNDLKNGLLGKVSWERVNNG